MTAAAASLLNALVLIALSLWGYVAADKAAYTALIPAAFGLGLLACYPGLKSGHVILSGIAALLTLAIFVALFTPLQGAIDGDNTMGFVRVGIMLGVTGLTLLVFVASGLRALRTNA